MFRTSIRLHVQDITVLFVAKLLRGTCQVSSCRRVTVGADAAERESVCRTEEGHVVCVIVVRCVRNVPGGRHCMDQPCGKAREGRIYKLTNTTPHPHCLPVPSSRPRLGHPPTRSPSSPHRAFCRPPFVPSIFALFAIRLLRLRWSDRETVTVCTCGGHWGCAH